MPVVIQRILIYFLLLIPLTSSAWGGKEHKIDSISRILQHPLKDTTRTGLLLSIAWNYETMNKDSVIKYAGLALPIALKTGNRKHIILSHIWFSNGLTYIKNFPEASEHLHEAEKVLEKNPDDNLWGMYYYYLSRMKMLMGEFKEARINAVNGLRFAWKTDNKKLRADCINNISICEAVNKRPGLAIQLVLSQKEILYALRDSVAIGRLLNNMGVWYGDMKMYDSSMKYHLLRLNLALKIKNKNDQMYGYQNIGESYMERKLYPQARPNILNSLKLAHEIKNRHAEKELLDDMYRIDLASGDIKSAYFSRLRAMDFTDSVKRINSEERLALLQQKFDKEKSAQNEEFRLKEIKLNEAAIGNEKDKNKALIVLLFLVLIIPAFMYSQTRKIHATRKRLARQGEELELKNADLDATLANLKNAQSQLVHQEKMASLGEMTAGIAYEIKSPVNHISVGIPLLREEMEGLQNLVRQYQSLYGMNENELISRLEIIESQTLQHSPKTSIENIGNILTMVSAGATRTAEIVQGLRSFTRLDENMLKEVKLGECMETTLALLNNRLEGKIEIHKNFEPMPATYCNPGEINQVFRNVLLYAIDLVQNKGNIYISIKQSEDETAINFKFNNIGEVQNTVLNSLEMPLEVREGSALGLRIAKSIAEEQGGSLELNANAIIIKFPLRRGGQQKS